MRNMKKILAAGLATVMAMTMMTGCGSKKEESKDKNYKIGILQFAEHGSLDNCRKGFVQGLENEGIKEGENLTITYKNSQADTATDNQIASSFASKELDMICAIATPSAQSAYNAVKDGDTPVVYTAITSPEAAGFVDKDGNNVGNITGTSDMVLADKQLKLIRQMMPKAKNVGILYSTNEANSKAGIEAYEKVADKYGFKIITQGISASADMPMAADSLIKKVDCITNLTDNLVVSNMQTYLEKANKAKIPVFGSEVEQVKLGCVACVGIDFIKLGEQTGEMAAKILKGEKEAKEMKYESFKDGDVIINTAAAKKIGMTIGKDVQKQAKQTFNKIEAAK
ncbi:ABC transporter substrate-binding protein [Anaerostipes sp. 494a]|uniref:ABC transporter substrate-binding protein n=1 Tax=Anaerostipes sp. 494a TaxID=1261636 RepID=UPI0009528877|nr:ABC transporter substrate-binding protein [Anaerostipes sp. 494a]OLR58236.1 ABC transporter substrate-binding protein [Anaerostipes sp. 494a]